MCPGNCSKYTTNMAWGAVIRWIRKPPPFDCSEMGNLQESDLAGSFARFGRRIFLVLSGYLITNLLMKEYGKTATIRWGKFYLRRAYRILGRRNL